jgi:hypothetical protein
MKPRRTPLSPAWGLRELAQAVLPAKGRADYPVNGSDLLAYGRCPARWFRTPPPEDALGYYGPSLLSLVALAPEVAAQALARRPDTYEAAVLRCPACGSPGPGKLCRKCGVSRQRALEPRPWTSAAKACQAWLAKAEANGQRVIKPAQYDAAAEGAEALHSDPHFRAMVIGGTTLAFLQADWPAEGGGWAVPLRAWAHLAPNPRGPLGRCLVQIVECDNADPSLFETRARTGGLAIRAALRLQLWNRVMDDERTDILWYLVERDSPRLVARRRASPELLKEGRELLAALLEKYLASVALGCWPEFDPDEAEPLAAFQPVHTQPWLTSAAGASGGFFALRDREPPKLEPTRHAETA